VPEPTEFSDLIEVQVSNPDHTAVISGSFFGGDPRIVKINGRRVEAKPEGTLLLLENLDRPGMIGAYGTILGKHQVNIANMSLSRNEEGGTALTLLSLDSTPDEAVIQELQKIEGVKNIHCMALE
jgi:D-3-phosphoglycerate dehydrogenase